MHPHRSTTIGLALAACCALGLGCAKAPTAPPPETGRLEVFVYWDQQALAGRRLDILELGLTRTTDASGTATFELRPGSYTLRAYVNAGGPAGTRDFGLTIGPGEIKHVDVPDCLPCVAP